MVATLKVPFLWCVMLSAFVRGYTVESLGRIFCLYVRDKNISCGTVR